MELYKYCRRVDMESAIHRGSVRIGTLSDYRKTDKYGEFVADDKEGTKLFATVAIDSPTRVAEFPGLTPFFGSGTVFERSVIGHNVVKSPDLLIFSASTKYDPMMHKRWFEEEGYDACYQISSARRFFRALTDALGTKYHFLGYGHVVYAEELDPRKSISAVHPALVKRKLDHLEQAEVRAIWAPTGRGDVASIVLPQSRARLYARQHATLPV